MENSRRRSLLSRIEIEKYRFESSRYLQAEAEGTLVAGCCDAQWKGAAARPLPELIFIGN